MRKIKTVTKRTSARPRLLAEHTSRSNVSASPARPQISSRIKLPDALGFELAAAIEQQIIYLELKPGAHLIEQDVCDAFGVSRSPVREAFRQLEAGGLVVRYQRRGIRITPMTETDLEELYTCRAPLEAIAAAAAARHATDQDIAEMRDAIDRMKIAFSEKNVRDFFRFNIAFFETMHRAANNKTLLRILSVIERQASRYRYLAHSQSNSMVPFVLRGNNEIFQAISSRMPQQARSAALLVIEEAREIILRALREYAGKAERKTKGKRS
ncbi:GntR family transcriptional regulator [Bradyrhizobium sp. dw_411]|uniref:GntR family transcriptional regulator n=1 Tax=Bradyrhizobium sp. dw_411 TaxID=2720082 RepID=UPI001BCB95AF|nr:GntR family transcriptional regulator [Bradyrhizobium sp. dw_411]